MGVAGVAAAAERTLGRALHSSTLQLNVIAFCGMGGALIGCS